MAVVTILLFYVSLLGAPAMLALDSPWRTPTDDELEAASTTGGLYQRRQLAGALPGASANATLIRPSGLSTDNFRDNWGPAFLEGELEFADCLGIFFPCFTGILSGANRAGNLADPTTAIPNGTLGAICSSYVMYMSLMVLWAGVGSRAYLKMPQGQMNAIFWPAVIMAQFGIILSSLGQALQCLVVAPKLLNSIAASGTIRLLKPFAILTNGEPKRALLVTYLIGSAIAMLGSLNLVAPLLSMCFLLCYACMNLNSFFLDFLKDPHWRYGPRATRPNDPEFPCVGKGLW